jgi:hypothetical protein
MTEDKTYAYYELSERAKLRALQELDRLTQDDDWWYYSTKDMVEDFMAYFCQDFYLSDIDVECGVVSWQGSIRLSSHEIDKLEADYCGEDTKVWISKAREIAALYQLMPFRHDYLFPEFIRVHVHGGRYDWDTLTSDVPDEDYERMGFHSLVEKMEDLVKSMSALIHSWFQSEYMYMYSDEYKIEMSESNDWRFTEEGEYVNH